MTSVRLPSYDMRVSLRAKRVSIHVDRDGKVEVVLPRGIRAATGHAFVMKRAEWIRRAIEVQRRKASARRTIRWAHGEQVPYLGRMLTLSVTPGNASSSAFLRGNTLHLCCKKPSDAKKCGEAWYRERARCFFARETERFAGQLGVRYGRIAIKQQSTLWGSCSRKGNLNFNWKLMFAPKEVARYIAAHECAHLVHLNHSKKFWCLVSVLCPGYEQYDGWLREQGVSLQ